MAGATDLERLVVQLDANINKYEKALAKAQGTSNTRARAIEARFKKMNASIARSYQGLASSAAKAFALIGGVQGFRELSDAATRVDNSLKVAGLSGAELEKVYQSLFESAVKNAAPIETLATLYGKAAQAQTELGVSTADLLRFTDNVALALRVAGTDAQTASGALLQLGQALGSGKVQAEEFNSVLEGAPTIVQAAAAGLEEASGSVSKLKKLVVDGKVSSEAFFRAFEAGAPTLEAKAAGAVLTIDQRMTNLQTSLVNAAREFNKSAKAGETFGNEIDRVSKFINGINWDNLITEIQKAASGLTEANLAATSFLSRLGEISGFNGIGRDIVNMLPGEGASKSFFGGGLTITSTAGITDRINQAFEGEIKKAGDMTAEAIKKSVLGGESGAVTATKTARVPAAPDNSVKPVSLKDFKSPDGTKTAKAKKSEYQREVAQIQERTAAINAETDAMSRVNPLVNDYGYALEYASARQALLTAAMESGQKVTPELEKEISNLAATYASASVASGILAEKQEEIRDKAQAALDTAKDVTRGIIDGFTEGAAAADVLVSSLKKIGDALINDVLNSIFKINGAGGGILSSIFGGAFGGGTQWARAASGQITGLFSGGGYTGAGGKYEPAGIVHKGEYVMDAETTRRLGIGTLRKLQGYANGGLVGSAPTLPRMDGISVRSDQGFSLNFSPVLNAQGADKAEVAALRKDLAVMRAELPSQMVKTVKDAQKRRLI
ncbi:tape measure protein [Rhizobium sp. SGZ-381]|uniref:tape measure protein n=1 Tax=Rhizobium sp. SGZ-381 TaxID=3342800 RepID=UPI00366F609A